MSSEDTWKLVRSHGSLSTSKSFKLVASHQNQKTTGRERNGNLDKYVKKTQTGTFNLCLLLGLTRFQTLMIKKPSVSMSGDLGSGPFPDLFLQDLLGKLTVSGSCAPVSPANGSLKSPSNLAPGLAACPALDAAQTGPGSGGRRRRSRAASPTAYCECTWFRARWAPAAVASVGFQAGLLSESRDAFPKTRGSDFNS